jgi:hypothetical protein
VKRERENYTIVRYRGEDGDWWWRMIDKRNHEIVGASHEGFTDVRDCERNLFINTGWNDVDEVHV